MIFCPGAVQADAHVVVVAAAGDDQVAARQHGRDRVGAGGVGGDLAEQAVRLVVRAGGEVQGVGVAGRRAVAERQPPQPVDDQRVARRLNSGCPVPCRWSGRRRGCGRRRSCRRAGRRRSRRTSAGAWTMPHGEFRSPRDTSRWSKWPFGLEHVDEAVALAGDVVLGVGVLLGVADVELAVDGRDVERGVARPAGSGR